MNVNVTVGGRPWKIAIEPASERPRQVAVTVDGRRRVLDVSWIDADTLSMIDGGTACEIRMHRRDNGVVGVEIGGRIYEAVVQKGFRDPFSASRSAKTDPGTFSAIKSPMPGRVLRVLVAVGDSVAAHQGVVVVEAMKMENELRAPRDGIVKEIVVAVGATVEAGTVLVVVE
ncbi:MAG: hypothetical protein EHM55_09910 [Acidobacteria bacterium]|nr:MAG: hypothetical protein EHM55_09910 [Acidobacteriota bacterium]